MRSLRIPTVWAGRSKSVDFKRNPVFDVYKWLASPSLTMHQIAKKPGFQADSTKTPCTLRMASQFPTSTYML
jgi:hypothetical protein